MFGRTYSKSWTVHMKSDAREPYETARFIREGFYIGAFLFGPFWTLFHRLWILTLVIVAFQVALQAVGEEIGLAEHSMLILQLAFQAAIAFTVDDRLRAQARRDGYITADIVVAESKPKAEQRFFERALG